jgi:hypothetical protein
MGEATVFLAEPDDWATEYRNIIEFYFWEPQHLNRVSPPKEKRRRPDDVLDALMRREVPLNHQLNMFFRLAPHALKARWLRGFFPALAVDTPRLVNNAVLRKAKIFGACQPDLYFEAGGARVFVELKVDAKSGLEQLCKYALLSTYLDREVDPKPAGLVFMGPNAGQFAGLRRHLANRSAAEFIAPDKVLRHAGRFKLGPAEITASARRLPLAFASYLEFDSFLAEEQERLVDGDEGNETLRNLINGMRRFIGPVVQM